MKDMFGKIGSRYRAKLMTAREANIAQEVNHYESGEDKEGDTEKYLAIFADVKVNLVDPSNKKFYQDRLNLKEKVSSLA